MGKSLADLRAAGPAKRDERALTICLAPDLVAEVMSLTNELESIGFDDAIAVDEDGERQGPPRRMGEAAEPPRAAEIRERLRTVLGEMAEHEGELRIRAVEDGEWRRWVDENPPRAEGQPGYARDQDVAGGFCDADALIDSLGRFAFSWEGEPLGEGDWSVIAQRCPAPDLRRIARAIVAMQERGMDLPKWRQGLHATLSRYPVAGSPAPSDVPPASS